MAERDKGSNNNSNSDKDKDEKDSKPKSEFCRPVHLFDDPEEEFEGCTNSSHVHKL